MSEHHEPQKKLDDLLSFIRFTHATHMVERVARIPGTNRRANTVEHSFQLAMAAWYLVECEHLQLNKDLVIRYALAHDLVETYAGDTSFYDTAAQKDKASREHAALERIAAEYPDFTDLTETIRTYETRADPEARFVYALDKLIDPLNIYLEDGRLWHEEDISLERLVELKTPKIAQDKIVHMYFDALVLRLRDQTKKLFPQ